MITNNAVDYAQPHYLLCMVVEKVDTLIRQRKTVKGTPLLIDV